MPNRPRRHESVEDVRIVAGEVGSSVTRVTTEDEQRAVGRIGKRAGEQQITSRVSGADQREMLAVMGELGMKPEKHHHELAPAQH